MAWAGRDFKDRVPTTLLWTGLPLAKSGSPPNTLLLALLNFIRFAEVYFSNLSRYLWTASISSAISATSLSIVSSTNLNIHSEDF